MNMNDKAANDEANADASRTSNSQDLDLDGDGDEEFTTFFSQQPRSPNQDDAHTHTREDSTPTPPASPLPLPRRKMEITDEDDAPMPASQMDAAFKEMEAGSAMGSPAAAAAPLGSTGLAPPPPPVRPASAREGLETLEDEEDEGPAPAAQFPKDAPMPDAGLLVEHESMMPPMPAALMGAIFQDEEEGQMAHGKTKTIEEDQQVQDPSALTVPWAPSPTPMGLENVDEASLQRVRERVRHQQEEILQQAQGPPKTVGDDKNYGPAPATQLPQDAPMPGAALLVELESMMPPMPGALTGEIFQDEEEGQMAYEKTKTIEEDQQVQDPPTPAVSWAPFPTPLGFENMGAASLQRKRERVRRQQEGILQKAHGSHTPAEEDAQHPSTNPPVRRAQSPPAITTQPGTDATPLSRTEPLVELPMRPPPRSMLPSPDDDDDVTNTPSVPRIHEVEATLYEQDSVVYLGTPVENDIRPWWEKHRIPIAIAVSGLVAGLAVAVGAAFGSSKGPVIASSEPEAQSSLPILEPSQSSPPSEIPSPRPTFHPSQSLALNSVRSAPPSTSLVPSASPSSSSSARPSSSAPPSASTHPTAFCFEGAVNIFTDPYPEDTSWTLSRITAEDVTNATVVREGSPEDESSLHTYEVCLERGEYEFTIYDTFGDGICCDGGDGHFELVLDGWVVFEGGEFGLSQTVPFLLPSASLKPSQSSVPSRSLSPTFQPSASFGPSSQVPSLGPTLSLRPSSLPSLLPTAPPSTYWSSLVWEQTGQTITGEAPGDQSGRSVALSSNGMTMAVGSPGPRNSDDRPGYVKVYHREDNASGWQDLGQKIEGTANGNRFGNGLALSEDGRTLAIGAPGRLGMTGYSRVYQMEGNVFGSSWKQLGQDIIRRACGGRASGGTFGVSIALSANGRTLAIGDLALCDSAGLVRIYGWDEDGPSWKQLGQDLQGEAPGDFSGYSVDLSSDGMTVAIGARGNNGNGEESGHVRVYRRKGDEPRWEQLGQDIDGEATGDGSGYSVSLSSDGRTLAIGAAFNDGKGEDAGHARVYRIDDAGLSWEQLGQDIDGEAAGDRSGESLSLSADGKTVAIGASDNDGNGSLSGHVKFYRMEDGPNWIQVGRDIDGANPADNAGFSLSLSTNGRTVAIGSPRGLGDEAGHVRVFNVNY